MHGAIPAKVRRKTDRRNTIVIEELAASICRFFYPEHEGSRFP